MSVYEQISQAMTSLFSEGSPMGELKVRETEGIYRSGASDYKASGGYSFIVESPALDNDPLAAVAIQEHIKARFKATDPFKSHLTLESERDHMQWMADELEFLRMQESDVNKKITGTSLTSIPDKFPEWFKELPKRNDGNILHALNVTKQDDGLISIRINTPKDADPELIVKNIKDRLPEIMSGLGKRTGKYSSRTDKEALEAEVKALHVDVKASSYEDSKAVTIEIMSEKRFIAMNEPGGVKPGNAATYAAQNPLMTLQNGDDDRDPEKPQPHLKKALARSFLLTGEKYIEVFHLIAGKDDMRRQVAKSLVGLKKKLADNPQVMELEAQKLLVGRIDTFLNDDVLKDTRQWDKPVEEQTPAKSSPGFFTKVIEVDGPDGKKVKKNVLQVTAEFDAAKLPDIQKQILALDIKKKEPTVNPVADLSDKSAAAPTITSPDERIANAAIASATPTADAKGNLLEGGLELATAGVGATMMVKELDRPQQNQLNAAGNKPSLALGA